MDSEFYGAVLTQGLSKPFLRLASSSHIRNDTELDLSLEIVWPMRVWLWGRASISYSRNSGLLLELLRYKDPWLVRGSVGKRAMEIIVDYAGIFLEFVFCGKEEKILKGRVRSFRGLLGSF